MILTDILNRPLRDLRISVTDRCNFRCVYCMPKEVFGPGYTFLERSEILSFEEITRLARVFIACGVEKVRLTGGEPLMRQDLHQLIAWLSALPGLDLALSTNGSMLAQQAAALKGAGLKRVNVSLDALDEVVFQRMNGAGFPVARVLEGIDAALAVGLGPVKVNMVVKRGLNDASILPMAGHFREQGCTLRFIEYMDVGHSNQWRMAEVVPAAEILRLINAQWPLEPVGPTYRGEVAKRWRYKDGRGEIGLVASVTHAFCRDCSRARISAEGKLYTCLFATQGHDLRRLLRGGQSDEAMHVAIADIWQRRGDRYSELRTESTRDLPKVEMSHIGG